MLAESAVFLLLAKLCLTKTVNRLSLTDNRLCFINTITMAAGAAISLSPDQPREIVAGNGTAALIAVVSKKFVFRDSEIFADSPRKLIASDLKNGFSDTLQFAESIIDFHLNFDHLVRPKRTPSQRLSKGSADS
jgi:hypothetical protein